MPCMSSPTADVSVRIAWSDDAAAIADLQVRTWREVYADLLPAEALPDHGRRHGVLVGVRPEHLVWHSGPGAPFLSGKATVVEPLGSDTLALVRLGATGGELTGRFPPEAGLAAGQNMTVQLAMGRFHLFEPETGLAIRGAGW